MPARRWTTWVLALTLLAVAIAATIMWRISVSATGSAATFTRVATVTRSTVQTTITAQGSIAASESQTLAFTATGEVATVDVAVGAEVTAGQRLATLASTNADDAVTQARRNVTKANNGVTRAQLAINTAQQAKTASDEGVTAASHVREIAQRTLDTANDTLDQARKAAASPDAQASATAMPSSIPTASLGAGSIPTNLPTSSLSTTTVVPTVAQASSAVDAATADLAQAVAAVAQAVAEQTSAANKVSEAQLALTEAQDAVAVARDALAEAQRQDGSLALVAPFDGVVTEVGLAVGDTVTGGGGTVESSVSADLSANTSLLGLSAAPAATGGQTITVQEIAALEVSGSFAEADAAALRIGQRAAMTFPALPGSAVPGWVTWISPTPSTTAGVVTYEAMVTLEEIPPAIRLGQTATVVVVTAEAVGVLAVPSSAVTVTGSGEGTVELIVDPDRGTTQTTAVGIGMEGDIAVE
ncbi:MAG: HlyD family efflux transporter periplasmic adaptor subunit, partial [Bifidobacteriaceae bacterium]|nr:HlyD family efflux transporter periplasmic adaptor subunit [Bifidobacteriaceae bacterium]